MNDYKTILQTETKNKIILKLICGAGNQDYSEIEKLAYIYSSANFDIIDISASKEAIQAALGGRNKAKGNSLICVSIGMPDDIHMSKACINTNKCEKCLECINICPQKAISFNNVTVSIDSKKCIGCSKCTDTCKYGSIYKQEGESVPVDTLKNIVKEPFDIIEFHCSTKDTDAAQKTYKEFKDIYKGEIGICLNQEKTDNNKIIEFIKNISADDNLIIQADGKPMSGGSDDYYSSLKAVEFAKLLREKGINKFIILSGGTNEKTAKLAKDMNVYINGIALGSYARKIVKEYTDSPDFWENKELQNKAIEKAKWLAKELNRY